jgi:OmpA-OmpF porin, OOP family
MTNSIFATLLNMLDGRTVGEVAHALGQPEQSVMRGMESSIAAMLGGLANKSNEPGALQKILDIVPSTAGPASWSQMAGSIATPNSPLMAAGKRLLPALFGSAENTVTSGISRASNLSPGVASTLLTMAGPVVMSFIAKHIHDSGMTANSFAGELQREAPTIRNAMPAGLSEVFWPATATATTTVSPVVAQAVQREHGTNWLLPVLAAGAVALGLIWLFGHARRPTINRAYVPRGEASRMATPPSVATPAKAVCAMPATVVLPSDGLGSRFLVFMQGQPSGTNRFDADQLSFDTGSARLRPEAQAQLNDLATVLTNCPNVRLKIAGFTDSVGTPAGNLQLSRNRANSVVSQLERKGVSSGRLVAEGDGEHDPIADNATADGRARNRRVAILITQN